MLVDFIIIPLFDFNMPDLWLAGNSLYARQSTLDPLFLTIAPPERYRPNAGDFEHNDIVLFCLTRCSRFVARAFCVDQINIDLQFSNVFAAPVGVLDRGNC